MAAWIAAALAFLFAAAWVNLRHACDGVPFTARSAGKVAGLLAAGLFVMQFVLSARIKALDRAFALDRLLRVHKYFGATAGVLALFHPLLVYTGAAALPKALSLQLWPEILGALALLFVLVVVATSLWRVFLEISFETWRAVHQLAFVIVIAVGVHSLALGLDLAAGWARAFWWAMLAAYALLFVWVKVARPIALGKNAFTVRSVDRVTHDTWNIELEAGEGGEFEYLPGQFAFLRLFGEGIKAEEHPFTISSSPSRGGQISFTIKESGDFTKTIGRVKTGDRATVDGPYGRFSHVLHGAGNDDLLLIAGGVGITPLLSMLRFMADSGDTRSVTLVWGNKTERDILFRSEIEALTGTMRDFQVHHVLSNQEDWAGPKGYITADLLGKLLGDGELNRRVFLCGPPVMMDLVSKALRELGVPRRRIHSERFAL
jgi:predicted ferric reductase